MSEIKKDELAKSVIGFLDKYGEKLFNSVKLIYGKAKDEAIISWRIGYQVYLDNALLKYSYAKPFLSGNQPTHLDDFYVSLDLSCNDEIIEKTTLENLTLTNKFAIIVGNAGSGKTMLMRHLFVDTINNKRIPLIPIFIELRELNNTNLTLFELIKKKLFGNGFDFPEEYLEKALGAGHFALFFDGFDEVADSKRESAHRQIEELSNQYYQNYFVISSRPDDSLHSWILFNVWKISPLDIEKACQLVKKTSEEEELKERFIEGLKNDLFEKHESFLSNPLLLSIMLITYKDGVNIPRKLSTFYERAYIALFERHDAIKPLHREKHSNLDIQDFKKVFSAFCFLTYRDQKYGDFSETEAYEYLENAAQLSGRQFNKKAYIKDLVQAVCLLVRDGLNITFSHRSFQEYFTAVYIKEIVDQDTQINILEDLITNGKVEIINLLTSISLETVEKQLIMKQIEKLTDAVGYKGELTISVYVRFIKLLFREWKIDYSNPVTNAPHFTITLLIILLNQRWSRVFELIESNFSYPFFLSRNDITTISDDGKSNRLIEAIHESPDLNNGGISKKDFGTNDLGAFYQAYSKKVSKMFSFNPIDSLLREKDLLLILSQEDFSYSFNKVEKSFLTASRKHRELAQKYQRNTLLELNIKNDVKSER